MTSPSEGNGEIPQFGILGSLHVEIGRDQVPLDSAKQRAALVMLLVERGAVVSIGRLADAMWGRDPPDDPPRAVRIHISRLRNLLRAAGGDRAAAVLVTAPDGYALAIEPQHVDADRFERMVAAARIARSAQGRLDLTDAALGQWRGTPLVEVDELGVLVERTRLEGLHRECLDMRFGAMLALGRHAQAVPELEALVERHPLDEHLRGQLMVALYRCGRQADSLAAYRDLRQSLVEELGVEPSEGIRQLESAILQQADDLPWPVPPVGFEPTPARLATGLVDETTSFVGRTVELRALRRAVRDRRVVVLTGIGGVGKSRLALRLAREVAAEYPDGVVVCELADVDHGDALADVASSVLGALPGAGGSTVDGVVALLRAQRLLLVLDNCERIVDGTSDLVERIVRECPGVDVLATSRRPLRGTTPQTWPIAPLDVVGPDSAAVELFAHRAAAADPTYDMDDSDRELVVEICRRLDGMPLAIELAAAQVRFMNVGDVLDRIDGRLDALPGGSGLTQGRHESLAAVLDWSYQLLPSLSQRLLDRLTVFAGGFTLDAAVQVCAGDGLPAGDVAAAVADLVDQSLLSVDRSGPHARYALLETVRTYAQAHLSSHGDDATWNLRHAEHLTSLAEEAAVGVRGPDEARWVEEVDTELANLRAAHHWACATGHADIALRLSSLLSGYAYQRLQDEIHGWASRALDAVGAADSPERPGAAIADAVGRVQRGDLHMARSAAEEVLARRSPAGDDDVARRAQQLLAEISLYQGRLDECEVRGRDLVERSRADGDAYHEALGHLYRVHAAAYSGRIDDARRHLTEGWRAVGVAGAPTLRAGYRYLEGEIRVDDDPPAARVALQEAIETAQLVRNRFVAGVARVALASVEARHGQPHAALVAFREIIEHWRRSGDWVHMWTTLRNLVVLFERIGTAEPAAIVHGAAQTASSGAPAFGIDAERLGAVASRLRGSLGASAYAAAEIRGRGLADDEVVVVAVEAIDRLLATDVPPAPGGSAPPPPAGTG